MGRQIRRITATTCRPGSCSTVRRATMGPPQRARYSALAIAGLARRVGSSSNRPARWAPTIGLRPTTGFHLHAIVWWEQLRLDSRGTHAIRRPDVAARPRRFLPPSNGRTGHTSSNACCEEALRTVRTCLRAPRRDGETTKEEMRRPARHRGDRRPPTAPTTSFKVRRRVLQANRRTVVPPRSLARHGRDHRHPRHPWQSEDIDAAWLATAGAGMIGAVLSVLQRMTSGSLAVSAEAHRSVVQKVGFFRPLRA